MFVMAFPVCHIVRNIIELENISEVFRLVDSPYLFKSKNNLVARQGVCFGKKTFSDEGKNSVLVKSARVF